MQAKVLQVDLAQHLAVLQRTLRYLGSQGLQYLHDTADRTRLIIENLFARDSRLLPKN